MKLKLKMKMKMKISYQYRLLLLGKYLTKGNSRGKIHDSSEVLHSHSKQPITLHHQAAK